MGNMGCYVINCNIMGVFATLSSKETNHVDPRSGATLTSLNYDSLPNDKVLDQSELKAVSDAKILVLKSFNFIQKG